jgi:NADPH-dependent curcumin reductase CurA
MASAASAKLDKRHNLLRSGVSSVCLGSQATLILVNPKKGGNISRLRRQVPVSATVGQVGHQYGVRTVGWVGKWRNVVWSMSWKRAVADRIPMTLLNAARRLPRRHRYHSSVGGKVFDAVLPLLDTHARIQYAA